MDLFNINITTRVISWSHKFLWCFCNLFYWVKFFLSIAIIFTTEYYPWESTSFWIHWFTGRQCCNYVNKGQKTILKQHVINHKQYCVCLSISCIISNWSVYLKLLMIVSVSENREWNYITAINLAFCRKVLT